MARNQSLRPQPWQQAQTLPFLESFDLYFVAIRQGAAVGLGDTVLRFLVVYHHRNSLVHSTMCLERWVEGRPMLQTLLEELPGDGREYLADNALKTDLITK